MKQSVPSSSGVRVLGLVAAAKSVVGIVIEGIFIAMLVQRFFAW